MKVGVSRSLPVILLMAIFAVAPAANAAEPERIIVTNARLVGRDAAAQDTAVNVLIVDGRLMRMRRVRRLTRLQAWNCPSWRQRSRCRVRCLARRWSLDRGRGYRQQLKQEFRLAMSCRDEHEK
jgi:hypothetical protein